MVGIDSPVKDSIMKICWNFASRVADFIHNKNVKWWRRGPEYFILGFYNYVLISIA